MKHVEHGDRKPRGHLVQRLQDCLDPFGFPGPETQGGVRCPTYPTWGCLIWFPSFPMLYPILG